MLHFVKLTLSCDLYFSLKPKALNIFRSKWGTNLLGSFLMKVIFSLQFSSLSLFHTLNSHRIYLILFSHEAFKYRKRTLMFLLSHIFSKLNFTKPSVTPHAMWCVVHTPLWLFHCKGHPAVYVCLKECCLRQVWPTSRAEELGSFSLDCLLSKVSCGTTTWDSHSVCSA